MNELHQQRWAVISERGVEASGMTYDDALTLLRLLTKDEIHGLCLVTDEAAKRDAEIPPRSSPAISPKFHPPCL